MLPQALTPFVEKRLESALTGHWQDELRLHPTATSPGIRPRCSTPTAVLGRAERSIGRTAGRELRNCPSTLFKDIPGDRFHHRDNTLKQFAKLYRENANEFPRGSADEDYRRKLEKIPSIRNFSISSMRAGDLWSISRTRGDCDRWLRPGCR